MSDAPALPFRRASLGDARTHYELRHPRLNEDGTVHLWPEDGTDIVTVPVRTAMHFYEAVVMGVTMAHTLNSMQPEKNTQMLHKLELMVTDSRIIVVNGLEPKHPGRRLVAHLCYPWIAEVGYRPKQSFLNDASLNFAYRQDFPLAERGTWWERLTLDFDKSLHPGELAREIVRRLAAHHLRTGVPDHAVPAMRKFLHPATLEDPPKGDYASYYPPAYVAWPGGVPYIESADEGSWEWVVIGSSDGAPDEPVADPGSASTAAEVQESPLRESPDESRHTDRSDPPEDLDDEPDGGPRLGFRERLTLVREVIMAQRAYEADRHEEGAAAYERILALIRGRTSGLTPGQIVDLFERAAECRTGLGDVEQAVAHCQEGIRIAVREHDESMELTTRAYLAEALAEAPTHHLFSTNLRRLSALADALRSREEPIETHRQLSVSFRDNGFIEDALHEFECLAELRRSLGDTAHEGVALAWQALMLRLLDRHPEADSVWDRSREKLKGAQLTSDPEDAVPTAFDQFAPDTRKAVVRAREEAAGLRQSEMGPEHLLLGVATTEGSAQQMLMDAGASAAAIRALLPDAGEEITVPAHIPFTETARSALSASIHLAWAASHGYMSTQHLLAGVAGVGLAREALTELGVEVDELIARVHETIAT